MQCHQWRRRLDIPSPHSWKETGSCENPSCMVQMRLEYLAKDLFKGFLVSVQRVTNWILLTCSLSWASWAPASSMACFLFTAGQLPRCWGRQGNPSKHVDLLCPSRASFMCYQAVGSGPVRQLCGMERWPGRGICDQKQHRFSHRFCWNFLSYLCWASG